mmetsp:Transcript_10975/g.11093  ORF Transcript_10975/g.11093 Transcript_10975/m.11093 type:complete len:80 (-) Transcript_10975:1080-1319(-)
MLLPIKILTQVTDLLLQLLNLLVFLVDEQLEVMHFDPVGVQIFILLGHHPLHLPVHSLHPVLVLIIALLHSRKVLLQIV